MRFRASCGRKSVLFQTFQAGGGKCFCHYGGRKKHKMEMVDEAGYFAYLLAGKIPDNYEYEVTREDESIRIKDAYQFKTGLTQNDVEKFNAGIHYTIYEKAGRPCDDFREGTGDTFCRLGAECSPCQCGWGFQPLGRKNASDEPKCGKRRF